MGCQFLVCFFFKKSMNLAIGFNPKIEEDVLDEHKVKDLLDETFILCIQSVSYS